MKKNLEARNPHITFIDFTRASDQAVESILKAVEAEVAEAARQGRFPSLERAFSRLHPQISVAM